MEKELYHVFSRGVEKRNIIQNDKDRLRFVHDLWAFNSTGLTPNYILPERHKTENPKHIPLVHIHAWCLMSNHYHLLLSPALEGGISRFIQKLNMGYTKYFNEKHKRSGVLWQGKHKKILIERDAHFLYIPYYIHLNPLDMTKPEWREGSVKNIEAALEDLRAYRWSSHLDYSGVRNFPSLITTSLLKEMLGKPPAYEKQIRDILSDESLAAPSMFLEN